MKQERQNTTGQFSSKSPKFSSNETGGNALMFFLPKRVRIKFIFCLLVGVSKALTGPGRVGPGYLGPLPTLTVQYE